MLRELLEEGSIVDIIATFIALAIIASFVLSLIFIIVGGISFILSAGNEEKIKSAIHTIRFAIIGFIITFLATFIISWIARLLDVPFEISFSMILDIMRDIADSLRT
jgi:ABC-type phosphate transport system permease subunit